MAVFAINETPTKGIEEPTLWAQAYFTTVEHIARFVDLPAQSLKRPERLKQTKIQTRLKEIHALLRRVRPWFNPIMLPGPGTSENRFLPLGS
ncbi:hypothetical protein [Shewanella sp. FJAT-52076]|uniref:hypothetical protein n=1 Tax=Shewanella sp. FJAT-52076 TaxID=2864202 RepID=UPI001C656B36|nr:hypothetical protein [Shewanella sp. FJAT-52076]QYJ75336.1 hypothetical protein K0H79_18705 [Shewanella sp. FJAT-52076]